MADSHQINNCQQCWQEFCVNCSDADYPQEYCSEECEKKAETEREQGR